VIVMDRLAREDIAAAAAAHRELGRDYDDAVAESLVERIGEEIDRRVDARLGPRPVPPGPARQAPAPLAEPGSESRSRVPIGSIVLALGSMGVGIGAAGAVLNSPASDSAGGGALWLVALIWIVIGIINVSYSRRH
jgi:hypothetical protein